MNEQQKIELALLKLRNVIADKERWIANANRELAAGGWLCDWNGAIRQADDEISTILNRINQMAANPPNVES